MSVPSWATEFVTSFYAKVADVNNPANYAAQFVPDGDLYLRGDFKGHEQIEACQKGFWERVQASKHHSLKVFYNDQQPDTVFVNGLVDIDNRDGTNVKGIEFVSRFTLDGDRKIKGYRVWTSERENRRRSTKCIDAAVSAYSAPTAHCANEVGGGRGDVRALALAAKHPDLS